MLTCSVLWAWVPFMVSVKFCPQNCLLYPLDTILGPYAQSPTTLQDAGLRKARPTNSLLPTSQWEDIGIFLPLTTCPLPPWD